MEESFAFEMLDSLELSERSPTQWVARYDPPTHIKKPDLSNKKTGNTPKHRNRVYRRKKRLDIFDRDNSNELNLPPFLRRYGVQIKSPWEFSGPSVLREESDEGFVEYKLRLSRGNSTRFQQLVTQLKFRISEGGGQCFYCLGVEDNGHPAGLDASALAESITTLEDMASEVEATATVVRTPPGTEGRHCAFICVRRGAAGSASDLAEVRIAVAGAVDGGKSTLISVLSHGADGQPTLDNGRGAARMAILRHKHEIESGRTSSVSHRILAYSPSGAVLNYSRVAQFTPRELAASARKFVRFSDLGGHQRYSKTSLHGLTSTRPDYTMLCICASQGTSWVTLDHLAVSLALGVPVFIVVTKIDAVEKSKIEILMKEIYEVAAKACVHGGVEVENIDQAIATAHKIAETQTVLPIFCVSCVNGAKLPELHAFFNALPSGRRTSHPSSSSSRTTTSNMSSTISTHFQVDGTMDIAGVGPVFSGVVISGTICFGDELCVGPDDEGRFRTVVVSGLHRAQVEVERVHANQHATVAVEIGAAKLTGLKMPAHGHRAEKIALAGGEGEGDVAVGSTISSSGEDEEEACVIEEERIEGEGEGGVCEQLCAAATSSPSASLDFLPQKHKIQTSKADIELLGKSWDFVKHLTKPPTSGTSTAVAASISIATVGAVGALANSLPLLPISSIAPLIARPQADKDEKSIEKSLKNKTETAIALTTSTTTTTTATTTASITSISTSISTSTSSSSADLSPCDEIDRASVVLPLRPRKGTVLLGCVEAGGGPSGEASLFGSRSFTAFVALFGNTCSNGRENGLLPWPAHQVMVHCGGVRQAADVLDIEQFSLFEENDSDVVDRCRGDCIVEQEWDRTVAGAKAAASILHHAINISNRNNAGTSPCMDDVAGTSPAAAVATAHVKFKFSHRPEFMLEGSRVILRDRSSGKVMGAGVILGLGEKE